MITLKKQKTIKESMSKDEILFKNNVLEFLRQDGFNTFANYLFLFDFNFCYKDRDGGPFIAAVAPNYHPPIVLINPDVNSDNISLLLRHEVGHVVMKHMEHFFHKLKEMGIDTPSQFAYEFSNRVGDYQISNEIYDEDDKLMAKHINVQGFGELKGLVTELDFPEHPEGANMDFDELGDVLVKHWEITKADLEQQIGKDEEQRTGQKSDDYVEGGNELIDKYNKGEITQEEVKKWFEGLFNEDLNSILGSLSGDKAEGFKDALTALAVNLLMGPGEGDEPPDLPPPPRDPRLKNVPNPNQKKSSKNKNKENSPDDQDNQEDNQEENKEEAENSGETSDSPEKKADAKNTAKSLSPEELKDLIDSVRAARDTAQDVLDDAGNDLTKQAIQDVVDTLDELSKEAEEAKTKEDAEKIEGRLKGVADFGENPTNTKQMKQDKLTRDQYHKLDQELRRARLKKVTRDYHYKPMTIEQITANIVKTIKNQIRLIRDSSGTRYNPRSDDLGYVAPGRYNKEKKIIPDVVFYFDVSGSGSGNAQKIAMGHRIEEALKVLHLKKKIRLTRFYFGTKVHTEYTEKDRGNSDAPIPHAIALTAAGKLDNVIIMTDDNPQCELKLQVPGYAGLLFYDTVSESLARNVSGKKGTSIVMIDHDKEDAEKFTAEVEETEE